MPHAIGIVAHHDDHALWMGGTIQRLTAAGWTWTLVAVCVPNKDRRDYFYHCCSVLGAIPVVFDFQDYMRDEPFSRNNRHDMRESLEKTVFNKHFDLVFTHSRNPKGEYGRRHANHIEVREVTTELVDSGKLGLDRSTLAYFSYDVLYGNGSAACADLNAKYFLSLNYPELLWKCKLCSLAPDATTNLNALRFPCPNPEAFEGDELLLPSSFLETSFSSEKNNLVDITPQFSSIHTFTKPTQREHIVFLLENLRGVGNGVEESSIKRARLFFDKLGITPWMVISNFNPNLANYVTKIKEKSSLPAQVLVLNVYDLIAGMGRTGLIKPLEPMSLTEFPGLKLITTDIGIGLQKNTYVEAGDSSRIWREEFVLDSRKILLRKTFKEGETSPQLKTIQLRSKDYALFEFSSESAFVCHVLVNNLDANTTWHFVVDKNEMYRHLTKTPGLQGLKTTVTAVLHSTHLRSNGQHKASYRHLIQEENCCDTLVTLTQEQYKDLLALGLAPDRVRVIPHPMRSTPAVSETGPRISKRVIYLARYAAEKQHDVLIRVFQRVLVHVPDAELHTYGMGSLKQSLIDQVSALGLQDCIKIHGFVDDIASVYTSASLGVMTSQEEGFSLFGLECLSYGCPLVAFAVQYGPRDLLEGQDAGFLIEPGNEEAMAQVLIDLLQHPEKIEAMRPNAIRSANRFHEDNVVREWQAWLTDIRTIAAQKAEAAATGKRE